MGEQNIIQKAMSALVIRSPSSEGGRAFVRTTDIEMSIYLTYHLMIRTYGRAKYYSESYVSPRHFASL